MGQETEMLFNIISQLMTMIIITTIILLAMIKLGNWCILFIEKRRIIFKLKKYELDKYTIYFNQKGLPVSLVEKNSNKIIFI